MKLEEIENNSIYKIIERTPEHIIIYSTRFETNTKIELNRLEQITANELELSTHQGKNIEHITRVTGYFSKVSGWNVGKRQELLDRYRTPIK